MDWRSKRFQLFFVQTLHPKQNQPLQSQTRPREILHKTWFSYSGQRKQSTPFSPSIETAVNERFKYSIFRGSWYTLIRFGFSSTFEKSLQTCKSDTFVICVWDKSSVFKCPNLAWSSGRQMLFQTTLKTKKNKCIMQQSPDCQSCVTSGSATQTESMEGLRYQIRRKPARYRSSSQIQTLDLFSATKNNRSNQQLNLQLWHDSSRSSESNHDAVVCYSRVMHLSTLLS